jgi:hypothetical protein
VNSEDVKANEKRFFDYVNKKDLKAAEKWIDEFVAEDFVNHSPAFDESTDKKGLKEMVAKLIQLAPDMTIILKEMAFENDILSFRHIIQGLDPKRDVMGMAMVRFKDHKLVERWNITEA